jgi:Nif-specific regulatory protein
MLDLKILLSQLTEVSLPHPVEVVRPPEFKPEPIEEIERRHILATLEHFDWVKTKSAKSLGIERSTLDRKLQQYGVHRP